MTVVSADEILSKLSEVRIGKKYDGETQEVCTRLNSNLLFYPGHSRYHFDT